MQQRSQEYNPLQHEDTQGDIMPGETVKILEPG